MAYAEPIMRSVSAASKVSIPTPRRNGSRNITRLERSAEQMSQGGSDIGEEIRRMNDEQKERSRSNSIQSSQRGGLNVLKSGAALGTTDAVRSRASSHATSIVDVNGAARWGGYSPEAYITSPVGSARSQESWSNINLPRKPSVTGSSRLAQMIEPVQEGRPLDSPLAPSFPESVHSPSRQSGESVRSYNANPQGLGLHVAPEDPPSTSVDHEEAIQEEEHEDEYEAGTIPERPRSADTFQQAQFAFKDFDGVHFSPETEEFVEVDNDGNEVRRVSARNSSGRLSMGPASIIGMRPVSYAVPPPGSDMVYYPAPVPRMLNMPRRLSQLPSGDVQSRRRSQLLSAMSPNSRNSAPWLSPKTIGSPGEHVMSPRESVGSPREHSGSHRESVGSPREALASPRESAMEDIGSPGSGSHYSEQPRSMLNERMSVANFNNLPPQLRASVYFEHQSVLHDVDVKSESAVATLDSILAASATAPVNAFMDHPYAGDIYRSTFAPEKPPNSDQKLKKRRSSSFGNLLRRRSSAMDLDEALSPTRSRRSSGMLDMNDGARKLYKRKSNLSMGDELERDQTPGTEADFSTGLIGQAQNHDLDDEEVERRGGLRRHTVLSVPDMEDGDQIAADFKAQADEEDVDVDQGEASFVQPATLLAELQVRKAQQKSRNRTAVTAFPQGMHSTLLQLDAVEEINKKKRRDKRISLAWEDPNQHRGTNEDDDDVPLGMLYAGKGGSHVHKTNDARDWNRPLGLMERRQLEDNEPLSSRRNRLMGIQPTDRRTYNQIVPPEEEPQDEEEEDENPGETLGDRKSNLKRKSILDSTIADLEPTEGGKRKSGFTDEIMSQFGGLDVKDGAEGEAPPDLENETLGQRRARLQRERESGGDRNVSGGSGGARPGLKSRNSMSNLLVANPVGPRASGREHTPARGSLLHASSEAQSRHKQQLLDTNVRSASYGLDRPLVDDGRPRLPRQQSTGVLRARPGIAATKSGFSGGMYNNGSGGIGAQQQPQQQAPMFASPTAGMNVNASYAAAMGFNPMMMMQQQWQQQPTAVNPMAYQALNGGHMSTFGFPMGYTGQPGMMQGGGTYGAAAMGMPDDGLDNKQRETIDRWRMGVAQ